MSRIRQWQPRHIPLDVPLLPSCPLLRSGPASSSRVRRHRLAHAQSAVFWPARMTSDPVCRARERGTYKARPDISLPRGYWGVRLPNVPRITAQGIIVRMQNCFPNGFRVCITNGSLPITINMVALPSYSSSAVVYCFYRFTIQPPFETDQQNQAKLMGQFLDSLALRYE